MFHRKKKTPRPNQGAFGGGYENYTAPGSDRSDSGYNSPGYGSAFQGGQYAQERRRPRRGGPPKGLILVVVAAVAAAAVGLTAWLRRPSGSGSWDTDRYVTEGFAHLSAAFTERPVRSLQEAREALQDAAGELGLRDVGAELDEGRSGQAFESQFYRFSQVYEGVPVYGRSVVVGADSSGKSLGLSSCYLPLGTVDLSAPVTEKAALALAGEIYGGASLTSQGMTVYSLGDIPPQAAWQILAEGPALAEYCFVSASSGEVLARETLQYAQQAQGEGADLYGVQRHFITEREGEVYFLQDAGRRIRVYDAGGGTMAYHGYWAEENDAQIITLELESQSGESAWPLQIVENGGDVWDMPAAVTAMHRTEEAHDFFAQVFDRNGFDDRGGLVYVVYNNYLDGDTTNAYSVTWLQGDCYTTCLTFGTDCAVSYDLVGHEYMHSVENSISNMRYAGESGALMEAYSDIFGELLEDWADDGALNGTCDWLHGRRNMISPTENEMPEMMGGEYWNDTDPDAWDRGGVHYNSTVISHAAWLMVQGSDGEALQPGQLAELFYTTLFSVPQECTLQQFRLLLQCTAKDMAGAGKLTREQLRTVETAMSRVGVCRPDEVSYQTAGVIALTVTGADGGAYDDYSVTVELLQKLEEDGTAKPASGSKRLPSCAGTTELSLKKGCRYDLTVTDNRNPAASYTYRIETTMDAERCEMTIPAGFEQEETPPETETTAPPETEPAASDFARAVRTYLDAVEKTVSGGAWNEALLMDVGMTGAQLRTATAEVEMDVAGYTRETMDGMTLDGSFRIEADDGSYHGSVSYHDQSVWFTYAESGYQSAYMDNVSLDMGNAMFFFANLTEHAFEQAELNGSTMVLTVSADRVPIFGLNGRGGKCPVTQTAGSAAQVEARVDPDTGKLVWLTAAFSLEGDYRDERVQMDVTIRCRFR